MRLLLECWYDSFMPPDLGHIGPITLRTYTLLLDLAILLGLGGLTWEGWRLDDEPGRWLDVGLWTLAAGVLGGRLVHVAIHWEYFSGHMDGILAIWQGGLSWQGAVLVGLAALMFSCTRYGVNFRTVSLSLAVLLPIGAILADIGCMAAGCAHGREVTSLAGYPPFIAYELPDLYGIVAPRFQTQLFGVVLHLLLLILAIALLKMPRVSYATFWIVLALSGLGTFVIDYYRGDPVPMVGSLRLDQVFDLVVALVCAAGFTTWRRQTHPPNPKPPRKQQRVFQSLGDDNASSPGPGPD